jgi:hypothetical protein
MTRKHRSGRHRQLAISALGTALLSICSGTSAQSTSASSTSATTRVVANLSVGAQRILFIGVDEATPTSSGGTTKFVDPLIVYNGTKDRLDRASSDFTTYQASITARAPSLPAAVFWAANNTARPSIALYSATVAPVISPWDIDAAQVAADVTVRATLYDAATLQISTKATAAYSDKLQALYGHALKDYQAKQPAEYAKLQAALKVDAQSAQPLVQAMVTAEATVLSQTPLGTLATLSSDAVAKQVGMVNQAITTARSLSTTELNAAKDVVDKYQTQVNVAAANTRVLAATVSQKIQDMQASSKALQQTLQNLVSGAAALPSGVLNGRALINIQTFQKLSLTEQIDAVTGNVNLGIGAKDFNQIKRQVLQVKTDWSNVTNIETFATAGQQTIQVAQEAVALAKMVGVQVPSAVSNILGVGAKALGIYASFATNPVSAVFSVSGMFGGIGGSGPDPVTLGMLQHIQQQLDEVMKLQQQTLAKLDELDQTVKQQHIEEMAKLDSIQAIVISLANDQLAHLDAELQVCARFNSEITAIFASEDGLGYERLQRNFQQAGVNSDYVKCRDSIRDYAGLQASSSPSPYLTNVILDNSDNPTSTYSKTDTYVYQPAWKLTQNLVGVGNSGQQAPCEEELFTLWQMLPAIWPKQDTLSTTCTKPRAGGYAKYLTANKTELSPSFAMARYINHAEPFAGLPVPSLDTLLGYLVTLAPFYELTNPEATRLLPISALKARKPADLPLAATSFANFLDVVAVSAAQEYVMSGMPVVTQLQGLLESNLNSKTFGFNSTAKTDLPAQPKGAVSSDVTAAWQSCNVPDIGKPITPGALICVLERNPAMLDNALTYWIMKSRSQPVGNLCDITNNLRGTPTRGCAMPDLSGTAMAARDAGPTESAAKYTLLAYDNVYRSEGLPQMRLQTPGVTWNEDGAGQYGFVLVKTCAAAGCGQKTPAGWYFKLQHSDGSDWYVRIPSAFDLEHQLIVYRPQVDALRATRQRALQEYQRYSMQTFAGIPGASSQLVAAIALKEQQEDELKRVIQQAAQSTGQSTQIESSGM